MEFSDNGTGDYQDGNLSVGGMSLNHDISDRHIPLRPKGSSWLKGGTTCASASKESVQPPDCDAIKMVKRGTAGPTFKNRGANLRSLRHKDLNI